MSFGADPFGVVSDGDQQLAGNVGADPVQVTDHECLDGDDRVEFGVNQRQFLMQCPAAERAAFQHGRRGV